MREFGNLAGFQSALIGDAPGFSNQPMLARNLPKSSMR
jgi:hypothetical protein